jgi:hypothetical protein
MNWMAMSDKEENFGSMASKERQLFQWPVEIPNISVA